METEKKENQMNEESNLFAAELADLPVTTEQTEEVRGGTSGMKCQDNLKQIVLASH